MRDLKSFIFVPAVTSGWINSDTTIMQPLITPEGLVVFLIHALKNTFEIHNNILLFVVYYSYGN